MKRKQIQPIDISDEDSIDEDTTEEEIKPKRIRKKPAVTPKPPPTKSKTKVASTAATNTTPTSASDVQWIDKYRPTTSVELCINPQKLKQVREALGLMINGTSNTKLLVITGPSGSSKSTTIKVLADELVTRDKNAFSLGFGDSNAKWIEYMDRWVEGINYSDQFEEFLNDSKYKVGGNLAVIIIEELPNIFHQETLTKFRNSIRNWVFSEDLPPLVICLTEIEYNAGFRDYSFNIENNLTADTLLRKELTTLPQVTTIKFNSIANRYLRKTINNIILAERNTFKQIPKESLNAFLDSMIKVGDVRATIANLQLWANSFIRAGVEQTTDPDKLIDVASKLAQNYIRENQINLFHAIGKIIYSSSEFDGLGAEETDYYSVEKVLATFNTTNSSLLNLSILENYHIYQDSNYSLEIASNIVDDLSLDDTMDEFNEVGIRSARLNLRKIPRSSTPNKSKIKFPRHFKMIRQYNKTHNQIKSHQRYLNGLQTSFNALNMIDGYYLPLIYNKRAKTRYSYNRLGGKFQEIYADDELPVEDGDDNPIYERDQFQIDLENKIGDTELDDSQDEGEMSDPIDDDDDDDDDDDNELVDTDEDDGFLSDPELDVLISQGRI